jgi:hypothetical protein
LSERSPSGAASGAAIAFGLVCAVPAAAPALARVFTAGHVVGAAVALVGATSLTVVPVGVWLRRAREAALPRADRALLSGAALSALPLALFGGVLKSTTHHRPLGGATFAVAALCVLALCIGLSFRVWREDSRRAVKSTWQNLFTLGCGLSLACAGLLGLAGADRTSLVDFLALMAAAAAAGLTKVPSWLARFTRPSLVLAGWVALVACAILALRDPQLVRSLTTQAPVSFAALSWLGDGS